MQFISNWTLFGSWFRFDTRFSFFFLLLFLHSFFYVSILGSLCLTQSTLLSGAIMRNEDKLWSFNMLYVSHTITFIKLLTLHTLFVFFFLCPFIIIIIICQRRVSLSLRLWQCANTNCIERWIRKNSIVIHLMN